MARQRISLSAILLGAISLLVMPTSESTLRAQGPAFGGARTILPANANATRATHIGVMGAVDTPGTYVAGTGSPLLVDVIRDAGGLDDHATGNVRIVRNGRAGQQTFYSPTLDYRLLPGDLIIADTYPAHQSRQRVNERGAVGGNEVADTIQLAFLNVLERPVVLRMRNEHATISNILRFLDQSPELASSIRVVETGPTYTRGERTIHTRLANGSVLIFDDSRIDAGRLPKLPPAIGNERIGGPRTLTDNPTAAPVESPSAMPLPGRPYDPRDVAALPLTSPGSGIPSTNASLSNPRTNPFATAPLVTPEPEPESAERPLLGGPSFSGPGFGATDTPETVAEDESFLNSRPAEFAGDPTPLTGGGAETEDEADALPVTKPDVIEGNSDGTVRADTGSILIVIGVLCLAAGMIWFLGRRTPGIAEVDEVAPVVPPVDEVPDAIPPRLRLDLPHPATARTVHTPSLGRSSLDELIEGQVELEEEPVTLPESMELFGRPSDERRYRVDAAESPETGSERVRPRRPHFVDQPATPAETVAATVESHVVETSSTDESKMRMLDRVLNAVHGANRR